MFSQKLIFCDLSLSRESEHLIYKFLFFVHAYMFYRGILTYPTANKTAKNTSPEGRFLSLHM